MLSWGKIIVYPGFFGMLLLAVAAGAGEVLLPVGMAALCHEMGHFAALWAAGASVQSISFTGFGVEIQADTRYLPYWSDIFCTLAGPAVNLALAVICARGMGAYLFAGANLLQGVFNLLPVSGLDGARALHLLLSWMLDPLSADRTCRWVELCSAGALWGIAIFLVVRKSAGLFLILVSFGILRNTIRTWSGK